MKTTICKIKESALEQFFKRKPIDALSCEGLHIFHSAFSNCSMRVRLTAEEKNIEWTSHPINLLTQENLEDWYLRINPKGLVPAIVHNGVIVTESNDIMYYLEEKFNGPKLLPTNEEKADQVRHWVNLSSEIHISTIKTYMYGTHGNMSKKASDMVRYREIQPDKELVEFHEESL